MRIFVKLNIIKHEIGLNFCVMVKGTVTEEIKRTLQPLSKTFDAVNAVK